MSSTAIRSAEDAATAVPRSPGRFWPEAGLGYPLALLLCTLAAQLVAILRLNGGRFVYSFDDPYVHLALAERIAGGHYGINPGEAASPSSSILWPLLLVPLARTTLAVWVPLALNLAAAAGAAWAASRLVSLSTQGVDGVGAGKRGWMVGALLVAMNLPFLVFTGLEHTAHVCMTALGVLGLALEARQGRVPRWLPGVLIVGVLLRYEGLALGAAGVCYLFFRGHRRPALLALLGMLLPLAAFSLFLHAQGLPFLPASVLAKGGALAGAPTPGHVARLALANFSTLAGRTLWGALLMLVIAAVGRGRPRAERLLAAALAGALLLALLLVPIVGYARYLSFAWTLAALGVIFAWREPLARALSGATTLRVAAVTIGLVLLLLPRNLALALVTPRASNNIALQHMQMHRLARDFWRGPVAVNDLGWVAWRNPNYVLDLWGLATPEALRERRRSRDAGWMERLAAEHDVHLAMIYRHWFAALPAGWTPVATLSFSGALRTPACREVDIFATDAASVARARAVLPGFARTLPRGASLVMPPRPRTPAEERNAAPGC